MSHHKTICLLQNSIRTVATFRACYLEKLVEQGYEVFCIAPLDDPRAQSIVEQIGVTVIPVRSTSLFTLFITMNFHALKLFIGKRADLVFVSHFVTTAILLSPTLLIAPRVLCVIEGIGTVFASRPLLSKLLKLGLKLISKKRVFMNQYELEQLGSESDYVLAGIGVDLSKFTPAPITNSEAAERINLLFVGRLVADKGVRDLFSVMRILRAQNIAFTMHVVGEIYEANSGSLNPEELQQAQKEFGESLVLHGYSNDVLALYHSADLLLLLSRHEGFPVCVMEANACGVPALTYDVQGCSHAIKNGVNGQLVPLDDIEMVANEIASNKFSSMRVTAREYAEQHFDQNAKAATLIGHIESTRAR